MPEDDATALEQEAEAQMVAEREAFEARFPPEAFAEIAKALKVRQYPENLSRLRGWLLRDFYDLYTDVPGKEPPREEQIKRLKQLREAASALHSSMINFDDVWSLSLLDGPLATDDFTDQFTATLQLLADTADVQIKKLALRKSRRGRPPKNEPFRQLTPRLVRLYELLMKEPAGVPYCLPDSGSDAYGSKGLFYPFVLAIWRCLQNNLPAEARARIPSTKTGLVEELKKHWPQDGRTGKK